MYPSQQTTTVVSGQPIIHQPAIIATTQQPSRLNTSAIRGLSIAQLILGIIAVCLGVAVIVTLNSYWLSNISAGIWGGIWIIITGALGLALSRDPDNSCLVGTTMAFNIISTIVAFVDGILFLVGVVALSNCRYNYYENYDYNYYSYSYYSCGLYNSSTGSILFGLLMTIMGVEFFLALIAAIYCCGGCCGARNQGVIIQQQQQQPQYVVTNTAMQPYPTHGVIGQYPQYPVSAPPTSSPYAQSTQYVAQSSMAATTSYPAAPHGQYQHQQPTYTGNMTPYATTNVAYAQENKDTEHLIKGVPTTVAETIPPPYSQY